MKRRNFLKGVIGASAVAVLPVLAKEPDLTPILAETNSLPDGYKLYGPYQDSNEWYLTTPLEIGKLAEVKPIKIVGL